MTLHRTLSRSYALRTTLLVCLLALPLASACDRNIEPFDPDEVPHKPDLSRIFPDPEAPPTAAGMSGRAGMPGGTPAGVVPPTRTEAPRAASGGSIRGSIEVAPDLAGRLPAGAVLFVIARRQGAVGGPPLAVLRVSAPSFPMNFEIGPENVMIPSLRFEGDISISAQLDADANAMTRQPGDLRGQLTQPVQPGTEGVRLVLDEQI
jgi:cytochrome c-type biogenesis protein CcmH